MARVEKGLSWWATLQLAFQTIGVVYGDIGTSPLYVYASTFTKGVKHKDDILGVLSLILYTITFIPLLKYVFIVLHANENGYGGTLALCSLICQNAEVSLTPTQDCHASNIQIELPIAQRFQRVSKLKSKLENSPFAKFLLLFATMLGSSMVIGDGILTPSISVLSAVSGIKGATTKISQDIIVWISVAILVCVFMIQRFGTNRVSYCFSPIFCIWFTLIGGIGLYNFIIYDPTVLKALNPKYIVNYFSRNKQEAWISLGGIVLSITGAEALFANVGHFTVHSIQISMCTVTYPALIWAYIGQAAFLRKHTDLVSDTFFKSIPGLLYWPMFVVAILASIIASQSMISGTFSIIQQSVQFGIFPPVKIVHTSAKYEGQVYVPQVNYLLMLACVGVTLSFRSTTKIGNAYGISVVFVMTLTSFLLVLIMVLLWKTNMLCIIAYVLTIFSLEVLYLSSVLYKFDQGGYLPIAFSAILMASMFVWNYVHKRKYHYEIEHKLSPNQLKEIVESETQCIRLPGLALFYYPGLVQDFDMIPPIFKHYMTNLPALHCVLIFISIKSLPTARVPVEEHFFFKRVGSKEINIFSCVARFGYMDNLYNEDLERILVEKLKQFIREDGKQEEIEIVEKAMDARVVHLIGETEVIAEKEASLGKRILINYAYNFLSKTLGQSYSVLFDIPHKNMLKVCMTCEL